MSCNCEEKSNNFHNLEHSTGDSTRDFTESLLDDVYTESKKHIVELHEEHTSICFKEIISYTPIYIKNSLSLSFNFAIAS